MSSLCFPQLLVYLAGTLGTAGPHHLVGVTTCPGFNSHAPHKGKWFSFDISDTCFTILLRKLKPQFKEVNPQRKEEPLLKFKIVVAAPCLLNHLSKAVFASMPMFLNVCIITQIQLELMKYYPASFPQTSQNSPGLLNCPESICGRTKWSEVPRDSMWPGERYTEEYQQLCHMWATHIFFYLLLFLFSKHLRM